MNLSRILYRTQVQVDIQPKDHKKCPRQFYLGLCFQMRTFIKDPSPSAQCAWQMSFPGDTLRAGKYNPVMQLWIKAGLGGHLRTHTKHIWGSQTFLSKASWMSKTLIECILRNALGSHIWLSRTCQPCHEHPEHWHSWVFHTAVTPGTLIQGQNCTAPGPAPSCSAAHWCHTAMPNFLRHDWLYNIPVFSWVCSS